MSRWVETAKRHSILCFVLLVYVLSWWPWLWYRADPAAVDAPILPFGPFLAAIIMLVAVGRWPAVKGWLAGIVRWRLGVRWYALVLLLPPALTAAAFGLNLLSGAHASYEGNQPDWGDLGARFVVIFLWIGLGEEPAWRGYLLPRLLARRTALVASLLVGILHAIWHAPLFGVEYDLHTIWPWGLSVFSFAIVITWIWLHTSQSLLLPMLMHASNNTAAFVWNMFGEQDQITLWWIWAGLWFVVAATVVITAGPNLNRAGARPAT